MPLIVYIRPTRIALELEAQPFASGGEGALYRIVTMGYERMVAKIIHPKKRAGKVEKLAYLQANPPIFEESDTPPIIWVKELLEDQQGNCIGYLMSYATGEKLEILTAPKLPKRLKGAWRRFKLGSLDALQLRLKVCYNLAAAVRAIQQTGRYVLVDLKPDNILIQPNGLVAIVDTDSIEVVEDGKTLYPATVATPEYTPPEYYEGVQPGKVSISQSWDNFSLAIIYYRLLFGIHPFAATSKAPHDNVNALGDKIKYGLFVHDPKLKDSFTTVPPPHQRFHQIDDLLQQHFQLAFVAGNAQPELRPNAEAWGQALMESPLLLTNRSLPSNNLQLPSLDERQWYHRAVQDALAAKNLLTQKDSIKGVKQSSTQLLADLKIMYNNQGKFLKAFGRYLGFILLILCLIQTITFFADPGGSSVFEGFALLFKGLWFVLSTMIGASAIIGFGLLIFLFPLVMVGFRQIMGQFGNLQAPLQSVRKKWITAKGLTKKQKENNLKELQYQLYHQRSQLKQRMREVKNELVVWNQVRKTKQQSFFQDKRSQIDVAKKAVRLRMNKEKAAIQEQDEQATRLMEAEAAEIKAARQAIQQEMKANPSLSALEGRTAQQKITFLKTKAAEEATTLLPLLEALVAKQTTELARIQAKYDAQHANLKHNVTDAKIKIDDLVNGSVKSMRQQINIDEQLLDDKFKSLLETIQTLEEEYQDKVVELETINEEINLLKHQLPNSR